MKKSLLHKIWDIFSSSIIVILVLGGTILTYLYARGYRINFTDKKVLQTGVLNVESSPTKASLYVNDKYLGKAPKVVSPLKKGFAQVRLTKEGYTDWNKKVPIFAEKSSSIFPFLTLNDPKQEKIFSNNQRIISQIPNQESGAFILLTQDKVQGKYNLYRYLINKPFWDLNDNPQKIHTIDDEGVTKIDISVSNDGKWSLLSIHKAVNKKEKIEYQLVHLPLPIQIITQTDLSLFDSQYKITWAKDSTYLILESKQDIFAYKVDDNTKFLLLRKEKNVNYVWTTDSSGFFYHIILAKEVGLNKYSIIQQTLQGNSKKTILENVYLQTSDEYIQKLRKLAEIKYVPITNSKENTRFGGDITGLSIDQNANGFFIQTTLASYWYDKDQEKYILIHPYPTTLLTMSPNYQKLFFKDEVSKKYGVFVFDKESMDPVTLLGTKIVATGVDITNTKWFKEFQNIAYSQDEYIKIMDYQGENINNLVKSDKDFLLDNNNQYIYQVNITTEGFEVVRYEIN